MPQKKIKAPSKRTSKTADKKKKTGAPASPSRSKSKTTTRSRTAKAPAKSPVKSRVKSRAAGSAAPPPPQTFPQRKPSRQEIAYRKSVDRFETALRLFSKNQLSKARAIFTALADNPVAELGERARVYLHICQQRMASDTVHLKTADELYDYGVGLSNGGEPAEAEQYLRKALKISPEDGHIYYALAATFALRNDVEGAMEYLQQAIQLAKRNRFQAQNDPDFEALMEDPRFTEMLYPETPLE